MPRTLFGMTALLCVLILAPFASAMQSTSTPPQKGVDPDNDVVFENLCDPDFYAEFNQEPMIFALDYQQLEKLRIELLERGFNPGFDPDAANATTQLMEAVRMFQSEYDLPVTGQPDVPTLAALSIPTQKSSQTEAVQRAKPSR